LFLAAKKEKIELTVFVHETRGGPAATLLAAAGTGQGNFSALGWGSILMSDNVIKQGASPASKVLGRATGTGSLTTIGGLTDGGIQVVNKFWFSAESEYKGASLSIIGTLSSPLDGPWELIVVGGTGLFRGYTGYVVSVPELSTTAPPLYVYKYKFHLYQLF